MNDRERIAKQIRCEPLCIHSSECYPFVSPVACTKFELWEDIKDSIEHLGYHRIDLEKLKRLAPEEIGDCLDLEIEAKYPCSEGGSVWTVSVEKLLERFLSSVKEQIKSQEGKE